MINFWKLSYEAVKKQRDQYKAENAQLEEEMKRLKRESNITVFCALEEENIELKQENKALRLQANTYFDEWQESEKQRNEFISYVNLYTTLTDHIRLKASANPGVDRYIALVNFIDRLERE